MILNDDEIQERVESPANLLNRLRTNLNKTNTQIIPSLPPKAEDVISNLEEKIGNTTMRSKAANILNAAMDELAIRIPDVQRPEKLAQIAKEMSQVISNQDAKGATDKLAGQIVVYAPQVINLENYNIVDVRE